MSPRQVRFLLEELCVDLGFCLPPHEQARIQEKPETDIDAFTDDVIRSEGLDPYVDITLHLRRKVRAIVVRHFKAAENASSS
jgi:hypothetical protein